MIRSPTLSAANPTQVHHTTWGVSRRYIRRPSGSRRPADTGTAALAWSLDADTVTDAPISATGRRCALPHDHDHFGTPAGETLRGSPSTICPLRGCAVAPAADHRGTTDAAPLITDRRA